MTRLVQHKQLSGLELKLRPVDGWFSDGVHNVDAPRRKAQQTLVAHRRRPVRQVHAFGRVQVSRADGGDARACLNVQLPLCKGGGGGVFNLDVRPACNAQQGGVTCQTELGHVKFGCGCCRQTGRRIDLQGLFCHQHEVTGTKDAVRVVQADILCQLADAKGSGTCAVADGFTHATHQQAADLHLVEVADRENVGKARTVAVHQTDLVFQNRNVHGTAHHLDLSVQAQLPIRGRVVAGQQLQVASIAGQLWQGQQSDRSLLGEVLFCVFDVEFRFFLNHGARHQLESPERAFGL